MEKQFIPRGCIQMSLGSGQHPMQLTLGNRDKNLEISFTTGKYGKSKVFRMNDRELWIPPPAKTTRRVRPCCLYKYPTNEITLHLENNKNSLPYGLPMVIESKHLENFKAIFYPHCEDRQRKEEKNVSQKSVEDCKEQVKTNYLAQCDVLKESERLLNEQTDKRKVLKRYMTVLKKNMDDISRSLSEVRNIKNGDHGLGIQRKVSSQWNAPDVYKEDVYEMSFKEPIRSMDPGKKDDSHHCMINRCSDPKHFEITAVPRISSFRGKHYEREDKQNRYSTASNGKSKTSTGSEHCQRSNEVENLMMKLADSMRTTKQLIDSIYEQEEDVTTLQKKYIKGAEALYSSQQKLLEELSQARYIVSDNSTSSRSCKKEAEISSEYGNYVKKTNDRFDNTFQFDDFEIDANNAVNKIKHQKLKFTSSPSSEIYKQKQLLEEQLAQAHSELARLQKKLEISKSKVSQISKISTDEQVLKDQDSKTMVKGLSDSKKLKEHFKVSQNNIRASSKDMPDYYLKDYDSHEVLHSEAVGHIPATYHAQLISSHSFKDLDPTVDYSKVDHQQIIAKESSLEKLEKSKSNSEDLESEKQLSEKRKSLSPPGDVEETMEANKTSEEHTEVKRLDNYEMMPEPGTLENENSVQEPYPFNQSSYSQLASDDRNRIKSFNNQRTSYALILEKSSNSRPKFYTLTPMEGSFDSEMSQDDLLSGILDQTPDELDSNEIVAATDVNQNLPKLTSKNSSGFEMIGRSKSEPCGTTFEYAPERGHKGYRSFAAPENKKCISNVADPETARRTGNHAFYREHLDHSENQQDLDQKGYEQSDPKYSHGILDKQTESKQLQQFSTERPVDNGMSSDSYREELHSYDLPPSFSNNFSSEDRDFDEIRMKNRSQSTPYPNHIPRHPSFRNSALQREFQNNSSTSIPRNWANPHLKYIITTTPEKSDLPLRRKLFESNRSYSSSPEMSDMQKASYKINTLYHQVMS